jgi:predicted RNase H-like HicB family nuclease
MKKEIVFLIHEAEEGGYYAEAVGVGIFAEGETMEELKKNIKSGIECYFEDTSQMPSFAHLHFVKDEVMAL